MERGTTLWTTRGCGQRRSPTRLWKSRTARSRTEVRDRAVRRDAGQLVEAELDAEDDEDVDEEPAEAAGAGVEAAGAEDADVEELTELLDEERLSVR